MENNYCVLSMIRVLVYIRFDLRIKLNFSAQENNKLHVVFSFRSVAEIILLSTNKKKKKKNVIQRTKGQ